MRRVSTLTLAFCAALLSLSSAGIYAQNNQSQNSLSMPHDISFTVSMPKPHTHLLEIEMRVRASQRLPSQTDLIMPVWTPGSYLIREFERNVQDFGVKDSRGKPLSWTKVNKDTWRIDTAGQQELIARYRVYCNEFSVRTNEVNDRHAFWNNAALLMYPDGQLHSPSTVRVIPFGDWKVATGLPAVNGSADTFRADNFDILYDSPFDVSNFTTLSFEVNGVPHRIVIDGEGNYQPDRVRNDVKKIVETQVAMMGEIPYHDYTFILHLRTNGGGGLEHLNSTALIFRRFGFTPESSYQGFLSLVSHEFFHLWNVKRIRPDALGPFNYTKENYTKLLWVAEGITEYYAGLHARRAGVISESDFLKETSDRISSVQQKPGRLVMSAEEASFEAWVKYYRPDENAVNSQISYYDKGALLGLLLDMEIRKRSGGTKSLDDVMRYLYNEFYKKNRNYSPEDFQHVTEQMAGGSLEEFYRRYVQGREELDYNATLNAAGLRLDSAEKNGGKEAQGAYLGAETAMDGDRLMLRAVYAGAPAYEQGLNASDQIVALDGIRVNRDALNARLAEKKPGDSATFTIFRFDELRTFNVKLGRRPETEYKIVRIENASADQKRVFQSWLGAPFDGPAK
jgi:predicted metalloprotease with PDZ domain